MPQIVVQGPDMVNETEVSFGSPVSSPDGNFLAYGQMTIANDVPGRSDADSEPRRADRWAGQPPAEHADQSATRADQDSEPAQPQSAAGHRATFHREQ